MWLWIVLVVLAVMATALAYALCRFEQRGPLAGGSPA
jgi:hypothetical protein